MHRVQRLSVLGLVALMACGDALTQSAAYDSAGGDPTGSLASGDDSASEPGSADAGVAPPEHVVANPFVDTSKDPFSTFAADVDTASYDVFRQYVTQYNDLPDASLVRVEDYVNFFPYDYPTPAFAAAEPFAIQLDAAAHPMGRSTRLLRVGIQAKARPAEER